MAGFHDTRLPEIIEQGAEGGPTYSTTIATTLGGFEQRVGNWAFPRYKWQISSGPRDSDTFSALLAFFHARQGRLYGFRFKDWSDYTAGPGEGTTWTDPTTSKRYLAKRYTSGPVTLLRKITRPVQGAVTITGGTVNFGTGEVTGGSDATTWTGEFDIPVRFDVDELRLTLDAIDIGTFRMTIIEVRE